MTFKVCNKCYGTKLCMDSGMMMVNCDACDDLIEEIDGSISVIDKRSKEYRDAIKKIMDLDPSMTKSSAIELFNETYKKL